MTFAKSHCGKRLHKARGIDIATDEVFVSDGAKSDCSNILDLFSLDNRIAVQDPVYPVYVDSNVIDGRAGRAPSQRQL